MKRLFAFTVRQALQHVVLLIVLAASVAAGTTYLVKSVGVIGYAHGVDPEWFAAAVMVGAGKGFHAPVYTPDSAVGQFLQQKRTSLTKGELADVKTDIPWHFHRRYRYLFYAAGLTWRVFGIDWSALKIMLVFFFSVTCGVVYGIFRLGAGRIVSGLGALLYMFSPVVLTALPSARDFCKSPFILGAILVMGVLVVRPSSRRKYLALSALLGAIIGFGIGFRDDLMICLLPAAVTVLLARLSPAPEAPADGAASPVKGTDGDVPRRFRIGDLRARLQRQNSRILALVLLAVCFYIPGKPILDSARATGTLAFHHTVVGLSNEGDGFLGIGHASYERMCQRNDYLAHAMRHNYYRRAHHADTPVGFEGPEATRAARGYLVATACLFPADLIQRGYSAIVYLLGASPTPMMTVPTREDEAKKSLIQLYFPLGLHFQRYGPFYAVAALVMLSLYSFRLAWVVLLFVLYFCGYTSLQFHPRHVFHLYFVTSWFPAFIVASVFYVLRQFVRAKSRRQALAVLAHPWKPLGRAALFTVTAGAAIFLPLLAAQAVQRGTVGEFAQRCANATLEPLETESVPDGAGGWTLFKLKTPLPELPFIQNATDYEQWDVRADYLVAQFDAQADHLTMRTQYETQNPSLNFSCVLDIHHLDREPGALTKYFFPVYEFPAYAFMKPSHFVGVAVPTEDAPKFKGLFHVTNLDDFPITPHLALSPDPSDLVPCQPFRR